MSENALVRVERVCTELATTGRPITFTAVAEHAQIGRAPLYRDKQLRAVVDEHRTRQTDARTLIGLAADVAHLRTVVEVLAATVTKHEEKLRRLRRNLPSRR
ncbi:hypothetical protein EEB14_25395 [Rhodococcus sp. WS4]|nr:hypothetical protein EEB14_25395 [Rhodococcus sp. WS4]